MAPQELEKRQRHISTKTQAPTAVPLPIDGERPAAYADRVGEWYVAQKSPEHRKNYGLYLTPISAADFMAKQIRASGSQLRILDPAAGCGVLACTAVEVLVSRANKPKIINIVAYEIDRQLIPALQSVLAYLTRWCGSGYGVTLKVVIKKTDFILTHTQKFDVVISNPPYFKIRKSDPRAAAVASVIHGQPNIYALFMITSANILKARGDFIFIVPRSFASGLYFKQFRTVFFGMIRPILIHAFDSRRDVFVRDGTLQENIIFSGVREDHWNNVECMRILALSSSQGASDINDSYHHTVPMATILDLTSVDKILRLPLSTKDDAALAQVDSWPNTLHSLGLKISTGRVVAFRMANFIDNEGSVPTTHVPLLWMNHVQAMEITWPLNTRKPEFVKLVGADILLVPNRNYVLLRRFSTKEENRRLIAAPYIADNFSVPSIGLENHLNYIYRPGGTLSEDEAWGLATLYNSRLLDTYFRITNGTTQVNATELRTMPLPLRETIIALGRQVKNLPDPMEGLDARVAKMVTFQELKDASVG